MANSLSKNLLTIYKYFMKKLFLNEYLNISIKINYQIKITVSTVQSVCQIACFKTEDNT